MGIVNVLVQLQNNQGQRNQVSQVQQTKKKERENSAGQKGAPATTTNNKSNNTSNTSITDGTNMPNLKLLPRNVRLVIETAMQDYIELHRFKQQVLELQQAATNNQNSTMSKTIANENSLKLCQQETATLQNQLNAVETDLRAIVEIVARAVVLSPKKGNNSSENNNASLNGNELIKNVPTTMKELLTTIADTFSNYNSMERELISLRTDYTTLHNDRNVNSTTMTAIDQERKALKMKVEQLLHQISVLEHEQESKNTMLSQSLESENVRNDIYQSMKVKVLNLTSKSLENQKELHSMVDQSKRYKDTINQNKRYISELQHSKYLFSEQMAKNEEKNNFLKNELMKSKQANETAANAIEDVIRENHYSTQDTVHISQELNQVERNLDNSLQTHRTVISNTHSPMNSKTTKTSSSGSNGGRSTGRTTSSPSYVPYEFHQAMERSTSERDQEVERQRARLVLSNSTSSCASAASPRKWNQYQEQKKMKL